MVKCDIHGQSIPCVACIKDAAIEQVERGNRAFVQTLNAAIVQTAREMDYFTTDDVWKRLNGDERGEPRALGAAMKRAGRDGVCFKVLGSWRESKMASCHGRPKQVWGSLVR